MKTKQKIDWIDMLKAIGSILVVIGHNDTILTKYIYSFHIPLFFLLSGLSFNSNKWVDIKKFIKSRVNSLLIPYFKYSIILFIIWIPLDRIKGIEINKNIIARNFCGVFYSQGSTKWMAWGTPMWFLTCLFLTSIIYFIINKYITKNKLIILFLVGIIGYLTKFLTFRLPWSLDSAFTAVVFYGIGHMYRDYFLEYTFNIRENYNKIKLFIFILIFILLNYLNGRIDFYSNNFNNYILFYICSFTGIMLSLIMVKNIENSKVKYILKLISRNTIFILAFHIRIVSFIKLFTIKLLNLNLNFNSLILGACIVPIIQILILLYITIFIDKIQRFREMKNKDKEIYYYQ